MEISKLMRIAIIFLDKFWMTEFSIQGADRQESLKIPGPGF